MRHKSPLAACLMVLFILAGCSSDSPVGVDSRESLGDVDLSGKPPGAWSTLAPVPAVGAGVEGMSVAQIGNKIYAALGHDPDLDDTPTMRIYDIASDTWSFGADAPGPSSEGAGIAARGLFFAVGGRFAGARNDIWSYNPVTDTWNAGLTPMPTARAALALARKGESIYAIGGRTDTGGPNSGGVLDVVERYIIPINTWVTVAPLPRPRSGHGAATIGGKIYVFGGFDDAGLPMNDVDVYNPQTDMWSTAPTDMPTARGGLYAVASKGGTVYVIGGWDGDFNNNGLATNEAYKVSQDSWTMKPPMPTPRAEHGAVGHGGRIYVVGGAQPGFGASVVSNEVFKP